MADIGQFPLLLCKNTVTIANGAQLSGAIDLQGTTLVAIGLPASFTGTAMTFETCYEIEGTYRPLRNSTEEISITVAQNTIINLAPSDFVGARCIKLKSGSAEGGARTVEVYSRPV